MWDWINYSGWVSGVIGLVGQNPKWALAVTFLAAIVEAVAIVGTVVPGTFIVMGIAGVAAASGQPMLPFLSLAVLGAVIEQSLMPRSSDGRVAMRRKSTFNLHSVTISSAN